MQSEDIGTHSHKGLGAKLPHNNVSIYTVALCYSGSIRVHAQIWNVKTSPRLYVYVWVQWWWEGFLGKRGEGPFYYYILLFNDLMLYLCNSHVPGQWKVLMCTSRHGYLDAVVVFFVRETFNIKQWSFLLIANLALFHSNVSTFQDNSEIVIQYYVSSQSSACIIRNLYGKQL